MLFNSAQFLFFFPITLILYYTLPSKYRTFLLLLASYYFYMCWKAEYALLILFSTIIDYWAALQMSKLSDKAHRKRFLILSLVVNLGVLGLFKYFNFFSESVRDILSIFNFFLDTPHFDLLLPVGISFYTFQTLSYSIDVYNGKTEPEINFLRFALYVSFFPQLVAGPIERSNRLLPQLRKKVYLNGVQLSEGFRLVLWGFFKKMMIADRLAIFVNEIYAQPDEYGGMAIAIATLFFAFQIYCDFSGYSDIAIGTAKMMGIDLMLNFRSPYFSRSIAEFWSRWHISLSSWFRDYVYIPLGGNRVMKWRWYYNLFITFLVSGLWHGANWTFVLWGAFHGLMLIGGVLLQRTLGPGANERLIKTVGWPFTFVSVLFSWILFRAANVGNLKSIFLNLFTNWNNVELANLLAIFPTKSDFYLSCLLIIFLMIIEWTEQKGLVITNRISKYPTFFRWSIYVILTWIIIYKGVFRNQEFIYFQF